MNKSNTHKKNWLIDCITALSGALRFFRNYQNPWEIFLARQFRKDGLITVADRQSGIRCRCTIGSYRMFGECWHDKDYDIPNFTVRPDDIVIDIGANQGFFSVYMAHKGAQVYAFEPFTPSFEILQQNLALNGMSNRVVAKPWAIAASSGETTMTTSNLLGGGMNTINLQFAKQALNNSVTGQITVPCRTLDQILDLFALRKIRLCKLDCEGSELEILSALSAEQAKCFDAIVLEYHPEAYNPLDLVRLITSWNQFHISFAEDKYCKSSILRAVSLDALLENGS